jgi:serine/threonine protein kinase
VRHKTTGTYLALKMLRKSEIVKMQQTVHVCAERSILAELNHSYIIRMYVPFPFPKQMRRVWSCRQLTLGVETPRENAKRHLGGPASARHSVVA